ncbi:phage tail protein I [Pectobacterium zantedeschiae]|uniref:Phage tail protein I n=1 Tax=Pectobacterium zantedeschiae TaxID=2034769 RepID=A0A9X8P5X4_9GAMM|nr:phage tail protein I [Pectobacterium zantedeschiae]RYC38232.1 phage tail protein I [Pectobacterium zantedeschiae]RYC44878.1 phage tail protein I [Pectobacterium zantedeschiae]RYC48102.1 phage tail protein I [Pectobacterium zantedeschiae]
MADSLRLLPPPLAADARFRSLAELADRFDDIDLNTLLVYLIDIADSSALPWLAEQFSLFGDGWELAESDDSKRALIKAAIDLHRSKGTPWSIKEIIRRFGFGDSTLIENIGRLNYDGETTYNNLYVHGDKAAWAVYRVLLKQPITNDQARMLRNAIGMFAPARCHLASIEYWEVPIRYNRTAIYDSNYNHGSA